MICIGMTPCNLVIRNQHIWRNPLLLPSEKLNEKKIKLGVDLNSMFNNIHSNLYDTMAKARTDKQHARVFLFMTTPKVKHFNMNQVWLQFHFYAHLVPPAVNNFKCKINTGCLDCDEKEIAQKKLHHKQGGGYWYDLLFILRISSSLQCCEWRLLFFVTKGILHILVWSSKVWNTVNEDTCNMYEEKTWINLSFHNAGCVKVFIGDIRIRTASLRTRILCSSKTPKVILQIF